MAPQALAALRTPYAAQISPYTSRYNIHLSRTTETPLGHGYVKHWAASLVGCRAAERHPNRLTWLVCQNESREALQVSSCLLGLVAPVPGHLQGECVQTSAVKRQPKQMRC